MWLPFLLFKVHFSHFTGILKIFYLHQKEIVIYHCYHVFSLLGYLKLNQTRLISNRSKIAFLNVFKCNIFKVCKLIYVCFKLSKLLFNLNQLMNKVFRCLVIKSIEERIQFRLAIFEFLNILMDHIFFYLFLPFLNDYFWNKFLSNLKKFWKFFFFLANFFIE